MMALTISLLFALSVGGVAWVLAGDVKFSATWQKGNSPMARYLNRRRRERFDRQLPEALATMSNALRAGFSLSQAFDSVVERGDSPISDEFAILQQQQRIGMTIDEALESLTARVESDDFSLISTAILISRKTGGNVTEIFDKISETIRGRMRIERKVKSLTAQGRLQGIIVSLMPIFLGVVITMIRPGMMIPFLTSGVGLVAIAATLLLVIAGWLMIRRIIRIDV